MDVYFAPFVQGYQSWSGILLLIRAAVFFASAFNASGDQLVNLTVVATLILVTMTTKHLCKKVYKEYAVSLLETFFLMNLGVYTLGSIYTRKNNISQDSLAYVSMNITLAMLIFIIFYHLLIVKWNIKKLFTSRKLSSYNEIKMDNKSVSFSATASTTCSSSYETQKTLSYSEQEQQKSTNFTELREELLD